ncbi:MAG TPA: O-antigen ligase family protein [Gaiellaceae bacterium]
MPTPDPHQPKTSTEVSGQAGRRGRWSEPLLLLFPGGRSDLARVLPLPVALALLLYWASDEGGFPQALWYPGALIVVWLLVICTANPMFSLKRREWRSAALVFFALFALWSFLSIVWATVKGDAWDGANQTLLYFTIYALFSRWSTNVRITSLFVSLYALGVAAVGFATIEGALHGGHTASIFLDWRLAAPIGYQNGEAALFLIPLWPVLYLASRREVPPLARGLLAATASLLVQMTVLAQSRGSMYSFPIVFLIFVVLTSGRGRALVTALVVLAASALNLSTLLDVFRTGDRGGALAPALAQARNGMIAIFFGLLVLVTLAAVLDRRVSLAERTARRVDRGVVTALGLALVLVSAIALSSVNSPLHRAQDAWHNFTTGASGGSNSSHFTSLYGTHRYDFWRVAADEFRLHPLTGIGANNFATEYLQLRRSGEQPNDPHSIEMKVLAQTGLVGAVLFSAFLAGAFLAVRRRGIDPFRRGLAASLVVGVSYWLVHGSVEWFWEIPAVTAAAIAFLGLAAAVTVDTPHEEAVERAPDRRPLVAVLALVALVASASYFAPWLSVRYVDSAAQSWRSSPGQAYRMLDRARALNPLSEEPDLIAGTIAERRHDFPRMKLFFGRALTRNQANWYARLELGIAEYMMGNRPAALDQLARAKALNPREPVTRLVIRRVRARKAIDLAEIDNIFLRRTRAYALGGR